MDDQLGRILMLMLLGVVPPLLGIAVVARAGRLTWQRAVLAAAATEIPVALAAGAFIFLFAECVNAPCPEPTLWERVQWWIAVGAIGAAVGAAVAVVVMSLRWSLRRAKGAA
jgi:hypothetical protein